MRKWMKGLSMLVLLPALLSWGPALAEAVSGEPLLCLAMEGMTALLTNRGETVIPPGVYDALFALEENTLYAGGNDTGEGLRYALLDATGTPLTEPTYEMLAMDGQSVIFRKNGLYGVMSREGQELIAAEWTAIVDNRQGGWLALMSDPWDDYGDAVYLLEPGQEPMESGVVLNGSLQPFGAGRMPFQDPATELYGYLDAHGKIAIEAQYDHAEAFVNELALASMEGSLGVIDSKGTWRIRPEYDFLERGEGIFVGLAGRSFCVVFDEYTTELLFRVRGSDLQVAVMGSYALVLEDDSVRAYTREGIPMAEVAADATIQLGVDGQLMVFEGEWGTQCTSILDDSGERLERRDQYLIPLGNGRYAFMKMDVAAYNSDVLGEIRYSCDYDSMRFGMMDWSGKEILPAEYLEIRPLSENRYITVTEDSLQMVDENAVLLWTHQEQDEEGATTSH